MITHQKGIESAIHNQILNNGLTIVISAYEPLLQLLSVLQLSYELCKYKTVYKKVKFVHASTVSNNMRLCSLRSEQCVDFLKSVSQKQVSLN